MLSAQRLFAASMPIAGTLAVTYLRTRGLSDLSGLAALRFHPRCFCRADAHAPAEHWPALIAAVTDLSGRITGVQRTYLARDVSAKAPLGAPRKALGLIARNAVCFGDPGEVMIVGEGVETVLSLRAILPAMPMAAALSAQNLSAVRLPPSLKRLYIAADRDEAGINAAERLRKRAVLGHRSLSEATRYTKGADQRRNAEAAIARLGTGDERNLSSASGNLSSNAPNPLE